MSVTLSPTSVTAGQTPPEGQITMDVPVADATTITLPTSSQSAAPDATVTVSPGSSIMSFGVLTYPLKMAAGSTENVTITASYAGQDVQAPQLSVTNPKIQSLSISPNPVDAEQDTHGVVTMDRPVAVLTTINLASNSQNAFPESSAIILPGQTTSGQFVIHTVVAQLPPGGSTGATITASYAGQNFPATLTVQNPDATFQSLTFSQNPAWGTQYPIATLTLSRALPYGVTVSLQASGPDVNVQDSVDIPPGWQQVTFGVGTYPEGIAPGDSVTRTITATAPSLPTSIQAPLTVSVPKIQSVTFSANPVTAGQQVTATVTLSGPAWQDLYARVESSDSAHAFPMGDVKIAQGQTGGTFEVYTYASGISPGGSLPVTISLTSFPWDGYTPTPQVFQAQLTLTAPASTGLRPPEVSAGPGLDRWLGLSSSLAGWIVRTGTGLRR